MTTPAWPLPITASQRDMLHALGYLYLVQGQRHRALVLLLLAAQQAADDFGLQQTLAFVLIVCGQPERALEVIERIEGRASVSAAPSVTALLRSRALLKLGRTAEARRCFAAYLEAAEAE